jgi:putative acetyltransferase
VGHVLGSWGDLAGRPMVGIAPLAVRPTDQGSGVGSALMYEVIRRGNLARLPLVLLLGNPGYYLRFGFEPASMHGIWYSQGGPGDPHFMVRRLSAFTECPKGEYRYTWEGPRTPGPPETGKQARCSAYANRFALANPLAL